MSELREKLTQMAKRWMADRAHTYASENADHYYGFDAGRQRSAEELLAFLKTEPAVATHSEAPQQLQAGRDSAGEREPFDQWFQNWCHTNEAELIDQFSLAQRTAIISMLKVAFHANGDSATRSPAPTGHNSGPQHLGGDRISELRAGVAWLRKDAHNDTPCNGEAVDAYDNVLGLIDAVATQRSQTQPLPQNSQEKRIKIQQEERE